MLLPGAPPCQWGCGGGEAAEQTLPQRIAESKGSDLGATGFQAWGKGNIPWRGEGVRCGSEEMHRREN